jgi:hypothetical protein
MVFDASTVNKKVQYITVDSEFVSSSSITVGSYVLGGNNNFSVNFGTSTYSISNGKTTSGAVSTGSNIFVQEMRNVIGLKMVDCYLTQVGTFEFGSDSASVLAIKYVDILCPDIPDVAQILDERKSKIFARIPLERDFSGSSNIIVNDKQWKSFTRQTNYFNPISIKQLNFQMWELSGQPTTNGLSVPGIYRPLQPDAQFYMVLEVTTIDYEAITLPKEDPNIKVVEAIEQLGEKITTLFENIQFPEPITIEKIFSPPPKPLLLADDEPKKDSFKKIDTKTYIIIALVVLIILYLISSSKK